MCVERRVLEWGGAYECTEKPSGEVGARRPLLLLGQSIHTAMAVDFYAGRNNVLFCLAAPAGFGICIFLLPSISTFTISSPTVPVAPPSFDANDGILLAPKSQSDRRLALELFKIPECLLPAVVGRISEANKERSGSAGDDVTTCHTGACTCILCTSVCTAAAAATRPRSLYLFV